MDENNPFMNDRSMGAAQTLGGVAASGHAAPTLADGERFGHYRIVRLLGRGGMGEVYEAEHEVIGKRFALKLLPVDFAAAGDALDRFQCEARVMALLEHPNILKVDDFGETAGRYWLRMELANGVRIGDRPCISLADWAEARGGKLRPDHATGVLGPILEGLTHAHQRGVVHRDLKPANILMVTDAAGETEIKIADFGLVRLIGEEWLRDQAAQSVRLSMSSGEQATLAPSTGSSTRSLVGTYEYMSPEQQRGAEADTRSDVYAVGLIAYRLLTGRKLGMKKPSELVPGLDSAWDDWVMRALEEDPADRFEDAGAMLAAMPSFVHTESPAVQPAPAARLATSPAASTIPASTPRRNGRPAGAGGEPDQCLLPRGGGAGRSRRVAVIGLATLVLLGGLSIWHWARKPGQSPVRTAGYQPGNLVKSGSSPMPRVSTMAERHAQELAPEAEAVRQERARLAALPRKPAGYKVPPGCREQAGTIAEPYSNAGWAKEIVHDKTGIELVYIPAGTFMMGSPAGEPGREESDPDEDMEQKDETQHRVTISKGFYMGKYEVTQEQWAKIMNLKRPLLANAETLPVTMVDLDDIGSFCTQAGLSLPTEAQWEHACRAGGASSQAYGGTGGVAEMGWYAGNSKSMIHHIGRKAPNAWGLYDMHGNVSEWCMDFCGKYPPGDAVDPTGMVSGVERVVRGGNYSQSGAYCRSASRCGCEPDCGDSAVGFRVALAAVP
jgi:formylglycine-generating enzyme required for sulfatase activity/serine/threonine protein kinase